MSKRGLSPRSPCSPRLRVGTAPCLSPRLVTRAGGCYHSFGMGYKPTLQEFLLNRNLVAMRLGPEDMGGLFARRFVVPPQTAAMASTEDGLLTYLSGGQEVAGRCDLVIAKDGELELKMIFPDLKTRDGYSINATCSLGARVLIDRPDLFKDFVRGAMAGQTAYSTSDLKTMMGREIKRLLGDFVARYPAAELNRRGAFDDFDERFSVAVERFLFGTGVKFERFVDASFASHEFEQAQQEAERRRSQEEASAVRVKKKEERIRRIATMMQDESVQGLLAKVDDDRVRALMYAKIMEDDATDLTPGDLAARLGAGGEEVVELMHRTLVNLTGGPGAEPEPVPVERADRIFLATGNKVVEIAPERLSDTPREFIFPAPLRSVRTAVSRFGEVVLGGGKTSIMLRTLEADAAYLDFPLPAIDKPRGGFNSMCIVGRWLFATHSEFGVAVWDTNRPGAPARRVLEEFTLPSKTTRAIAPVDGGFVFATGPDVFHVKAPGAADAFEDLELGLVHTRYASGGDSPVTCVAASPNFVFAGTAAGSVLAWRIGELASPQVLGRRKDPIAAMQTASLNRIPHLLYSSHDLAVHARVIGQTLETNYESGGSSVAFMAAASDLVCALDSSGMHLAIWKASQPARPAESLDCWRYAQKPVLDLWMRRSPARRSPEGEGGATAAVQDDNPLPAHMRLEMTFDDLMRANDRGIQNLIIQIDTSQLSLALKTASEPLKDKFLSNVSKRAAEIVREEMDFMGPVRLADVESAQAAIVEKARQLRARGELLVDGLDEIVV